MSKLDVHNITPSGGGHPQIHFLGMVRLKCFFFIYSPLLSSGQVAGRLHVEVVRVGGGLEDNMAGGDETDNNQDAEVPDRKLVCMVRKTDHQRVLYYRYSYSTCLC